MVELFTQSKWECFEEKMGDIVTLSFNCQEFSSVLHFLIVVGPENFRLAPQ